VVQSDTVSGNRPTPPQSSNYVRDERPETRLRATPAVAEREGLRKFAPYGTGVTAG
jgi:hypothetical protein